MTPEERVELIATSQGPMRDGYRGTAWLSKRKLTGTLFLSAGAANRVLRRMVRDGRLAVRPAAGGPEYAWRSMIEAGTSTGTPETSSSRDAPSTSPQVVDQAAETASRRRRGDLPARRPSVDVARSAGLPVGAHGA